jgi:hypothetical protein
VGYYYHQRWRLQEAQHINQGLFALKKRIDALNQQHGGSSTTHCDWRGATSRFQHSPATVPHNLHLLYKIIKGMLPLLHIRNH